MEDGSAEPQDTRGGAERSPSPRRGEGWGEGAPRVLRPIVKRSSRGPSGGLRLPMHTKLTTLLADHQVTTFARPWFGTGDLRPRT